MNLRTPKDKKYEEPKINDRINQGDIYEDKSEKGKHYEPTRNQKFVT